MQREELLEGVWVDIVPVVQDERGTLLAREVGRSLPFTPKRFFFIFDVPEARRRGNHAHKECHQLLICLQGSVNCIVDNGSERAEYSLELRNAALYMPPMVWGTQIRYHDDAILMVAASHEYDSMDYIRDYDEFLKLTRSD